MKLIKKNKKIKKNKMIIKKKIMIRKIILLILLILKRSVINKNKMNYLNNLNNNLLKLQLKNCLIKKIEKMKKNQKYKCYHQNLTLLQFNYCIPKLLKFGQFKQE